MLLDLNEISFFLVHMMDQINVDTPCYAPEKLLRLLLREVNVQISKLRLIVSKRGAN